jgi:hypothetical protein
MKKTLNILIIAVLSLLPFVFIGFLAYRNSQNKDDTPLFQHQVVGLETIISQDEKKNPQIQIVHAENTAVITMDSPAGSVTEGSGQTTFSNVYPNTDAVYRKVSNGIKEDIVLYQKPSDLPVYNFSIDTQGMTIQFFEGQYHFFDKEGYARFTIPKPFMVDAKGKKSEAVSISFEKVGKGYKSTIKPDFSWLSSPERAYPVKIDPTVIVSDTPLREIIQRRTISTKTYDLGQGKFATTSGLSAIHYQDENGNWGEIDNTIVPSDDSEYDFMNVTNNFQVFFSTDGFGNKKAVKFQVKDAWMKFSLVGGAGVGEKASTSNENVFSFNDVYTDGSKVMDANYTLSDTKLLEEIVLNEFQGYPELKQEIELFNAYFKMEGKTVVAYRKDTNELLWVIPEPVMYEVANPEFRSFGLHYEIQTLNENTVLLTKVLDQEGKDWLSDSNRVYPLVIDTTAGPNAPGTVADDATVGSTAWTGPSSAIASDNIYAAVNGFSVGGTHYLKATNFGFSLIGSETIDGILVEADERFNVSGYIVYEESVKIVKADGSFGSENKANKTTGRTSNVEATYTFGGSSDLWSEPLTATDINDPDFGVAVSYDTTSGCLTKNSFVTTPTGYVGIKDLKDGDKVLSFNESTKQIEEDTVSGTVRYPKMKRETYYIYTGWFERRIEATSDHKFYTNRGLLEAKDLKEKDILMDQELTNRKITRIIKVSKTEYVYDISVKKNHNYFVNRVLVHNTPIALWAYVDQIRISVYYSEGGTEAATSQVKFGGVRMSGVKVY